MQIFVKTKTLKNIVINSKNFKGFDEIIASRIENAVATFSMIDVATGCYIIANKPANIRLAEENGNCAGCADIELFFQLNKTHTKKTGLYRGEFRLDFINVEEQESIVIPGDSDLEIIITDSITNTLVNQELVPLPEIPTYPTDDNQKILTLDEFNYLVSISKLKPGASYLVLLDDNEKIVVISATESTVLPFGRKYKNNEPLELVYKTDIRDSSLYIAPYKSDIVYKTPAHVKELVLAGEFIYGELQNTQPEDSQLGMEFSMPYYKYKYTYTQSNDTMAWVRIIKG